MQELKVQAKQANIETNFTEVRENLKFSLEKYKGLLVSEETLKDCKATQKELAGLRNKVDSYRLEIKFKLQEPIKKFEEECKELLSLIVEVEKPIKDGIAKFDEERRQEKVLLALDYLNKQLEENNINEKFRKNISIHDIKINLTNSIKSIKEEIDFKISNIKALQEAEEKEKEILKAAVMKQIEQENSELNTKLTYSEFSDFVEEGWTVDKLMTLIKGQANKIKQAEGPGPGPVPAIEHGKSTSLKAEQSEEINENEEKFFVKLKVSASKDNLKRLKNFLNCYDYNVEVVGQGKC